MKVMLDNYFGENIKDIVISILILVIKTTLEILKNYQTAWYGIEGKKLGIDPVDDCITKSISDWLSKSY